MEGGLPPSCAGGRRCSTGGGVCGNEANVLSGAYITAKKAGDELTAKQHLSMLVSIPGMTEARAMELCSERTALVPEMKVFVTQPGNHLVTGVFESLMSSSSSSTPVAALVTGVSVVDLCRLCSGGGCSGRGRRFSGGGGGGGRVVVVGGGGCSTGGSWWR